MNTKAIEWLGLVGLCLTTIGCADSKQEGGGTKQASALGASSAVPAVSSDKEKRKWAELNELGTKISQLANKKPCESFPIKALEAGGVENVTWPKEGNGSGTKFLCDYDYGDMSKYAGASPRELEFYKTSQTLMEGPSAILEYVCHDPEARKNVDGLGVKAIACESLVLRTPVLVVSYSPGRVAIIHQHNAMGYETYRDFPAKHELQVAKGIIAYYKN